MKLKILIGVLVFLILVNLATIGSYVYFQFTRPPFPPPEWHRDHPPPSPEERLDHRQRREVRRLLRAFMDSTRQAREEIEQLEREIFHLLQQTPAPEEEIEARLNAIAERRMFISRTAIRYLIKTKAFLTPAQQQRFFHALLQARSGMTHPGRSRGKKPFFRRMHPDEYSPEPQPKPEGEQP